MKLPYRLAELFGWFLLVHLLRGPVQHVLLAPDRLGVISRLFSVHGLILSITGMAAFFAYCFSVYSILYLFQRKWAWWRLIPVILAGAFLCIPFRAFLEEGIVRYITGTGNYNPATTARYYFSDNLYFAILYTSIGAIFYLAQLSAFNRDRAQRAELEKRESELKFLRSQVNPHFLFNTLNNVYAQVQAGSGQALKTIERLSGLMRYSLYEKADYVPLSREIDHLTDFIELENVRLPPERKASIRMGVLQSDWKVPPMLLLPFVENAFKHGDGTADAPPVSIELMEEPFSELVFIVRNGKSPYKAKNRQPGGIGIPNVRHRLTLLYPDRHSLDIQENERTFSVRLTLKQ